MKRLLVAFCYALFWGFTLQVAEPQTYYTTEAQLQKLEMICHTYKVSNQTLQSRLKELQATAETLQTDCDSLKKNLQAERETVMSLSESLKQYELNSARNEAEKFDLQNKLQEERLKVQKQKNTILGLIAIISGLITVGITYFIIKLKGVI